MFFNSVDGIMRGVNRLVKRLEAHENWSKEQQAWHEGEASRHQVEANRHATERSRALNVRVKLIDLLS